MDTLPFTTEALLLDLVEQQSISASIQRQRGIGTSNPSQLLEVSATDAIPINDPATIGVVDRYTGGIEYYTNDASGGAKVARSVKGYHVDISGTQSWIAIGAEDVARLLIPQRGNRYECSQ